MGRNEWITPFKKQCFVVVGASMNMSQIGMVMGYASSLVPQLRTAGIVDDDAASWVAAIPGIALLLGNILIPKLMVKYGRRAANLISIAIVIAGWGSIAAATNLPTILVGRLLQGLSAGMSSCLVPIMIGEYTSPKNRGAFTILMALIMAAGTFIVHAVGSYATWKITALVCTILSSTDFVIVFLSPETPCWLSDQKRYSECENVFRWLRGPEEDEEELAKMIETSKIFKQDSRERSSGLSLSTIKKKEFYKPIIIMFHLYGIGQWAGINILAPFIGNLVEAVAGTDVNRALVIMSVDIQRMVSCVLAIFIIRRLKRRTMVFTTIGLNSVALFLIAAYVFAKDRVFSPPLGISLLHLFMITVATGSLPLPYAIAGEIFPLKYKGISGGISAVFCSINAFLSVKTYPFLEKQIGVDGAFLLYGGIVVYCLIVTWFLLPETKDRTLQEIEDELKGKRAEEDIMSAQPLNDMKKEANDTSA